VAANVPSTSCGGISVERADTRSGAEDAQMRAAVETFARDLSKPRQWILLGKSQGIAYGDIAARLGRSRPWVAQRKQGVLDRLATELMSQFEADHHVPAMEELLAWISRSLGERAER
jgi:DNA-directed RNA polymerase specialized sigma24 family protein